VHVSTEQNTESRNGVESQSSHRSIVFSHPTDSVPLSLTKTIDCGTISAPISQETPEPTTSSTNTTMNGEQERRVAAEMVADEVVGSLMSELFDASQLEEARQ
jgi:hypothetical protein